ncbi:MAG: MFS transporter [Nocardioidaceae bacterium]|nr:MAG: MFS transporter [Nocardioidaceae bacterium]
MVRFPGGTGVAACLRPVLASVGPVLADIGDSYHLGETALGVLGALPLLVWAAFSPFAPGVGRRWGLERSILLALLVLAGGMAIRSWAGAGGLWLGTAVAAAALAVGNVLLPAVVKRDFPRNLALVTGAYSAVIGISAALASGLSVPFAQLLGGWRNGLAAWMLLPIVVALLWVLRMRRSLAAVRPTAVSSTSRHGLRLLRSSMAWQVTVFFGLQSATFYTLITWLPAIEDSYGYSAATSGLHLFLYQFFGVLCGLAVTALMRARQDQRLAAVLVSLPVAIAMTGLMAFPGAAILWVVVASCGAVAALTVSLGLIVLRTTSSEEASALSGMTQSIGYLLAAIGPIGAGLLAQAADDWQPVLTAMVVVSLVQTVLSLWAGRTAPSG